jgi:N-acyl-D-aspartate/D-glutamate deacylase
LALSILGGSVIKGFDMVTRGGYFFDGTGAHPAIRDVVVRAGRLDGLGGVCRIVNRNDDAAAAAATILGGHLVCRYGTFADGFGTTRSSVPFLRAGRAQSDDGWSS